MQVVQYAKEYGNRAVKGPKECTLIHRLEFVMIEALRLASVYCVSLQDISV